MKKIVRVILSFCLVFLMSVGFGEGAFAQQLPKDIKPDHPYYEDLVWAAKFGLLKTNKKGEYHPDFKMNVSDYVHLKYRMYGKGFGEKQAKEGYSLFHRDSHGIKYRMYGLKPGDPDFVAAMASKPDAMTFGLDDYVYMDQGLGYEGAVTFKYYPNHPITRLYIYHLIGVPRDSNIMKYHNVCGDVDTVAYIGGIISGKDKHRFDTFRMLPGADVYFTKYKKDLVADDGMTWSLLVTMIYGGYAGNGPSSGTEAWGIKLLQQMHVLPVPATYESLRYDKPITKGEAIHLIHEASNFLAQYNINMLANRLYQ